MKAEATKTTVLASNHHPATRTEHFVSKIIMHQKSAGQVMEEQMRSKNPLRTTPANLMKAELDKLTTTRAKPCLMKTS